MSIPKIIHYCWVGGNEKPKNVQRCINSWKTKCPDYKIIEWNENNFDISINSYCKEAYDAKAWGFVPDYIRLWVVYNFGGIYLDTDVQVLKSFNSLLNQSGFCGLETENYVALGLGFGAEKNNPVIKAMLKQYEDLHYLNADGTYNRTPSPHYSTEIFKEFGFIPGVNKTQKIKDFTIYPIDYFCPKDFNTGLLKITLNTYSIHQYDSSWYTEEEQKEKIIRWQNSKKDYIKHIPNRLLSNLLGETVYRKAKQIIKSRLKKSS